VWASRSPRAPTSTSASTSACPRSSRATTRCTASTKSSCRTTSSNNKHWRRSWASRCSWGCSMKCSALVLVVIAAGCVQSSGFSKPPPADNIVTIDGKSQSWKAVHVEVPKDGKPYADGRIARISGILGELTVFVELGDYDDHDVEPFGVVNV